MVGQLRDVEKVRGETAHQLARAVFIVVPKAQILHVVKEVPADIRLHQNAERVTVIADHIAQSRPEGKRRHHDRHDSKKRLPCVCRQQRIHTPPGNERKRQIDQ